MSGSWRSAVILRPDRRPHGPWGRLADPISRTISRRWRATLTILLPVVVGEPVAGDRTEPCDRFGPAVEVLPVADRLQERLLSDFLGDLDVAATASVEVAVDPLDGVVVPGAEGNGVAEGLGEVAACRSSAVTTNPTTKSTRRSALGLSGNRA